MTSASLGFGFLLNLKDFEYFEKFSFDFNRKNNQVLITPKDKIISVKNSGRLESLKDLNLLTPTTRDLQRFRSIGLKSEPSLILFVSDAPSYLKIATFNLGYRVQSNEILGSEAPQVKICQLTYSQTKGMAPNKKISQCTENGLNFILDYEFDLVGLQEVNTKYLDYYQSKFSPDYEILGKNYNYLVAKKSSLGKVENLGSFPLGDREILLCWSERQKLLILNLHAPHQIDLKIEIEKSFSQFWKSQRLDQMYSPSRILVLGDFNDCYFKPLVELKLLGRKLKQHGKSEYSCCTDTSSLLCYLPFVATKGQMLTCNNFRCLGDYIFDTEYFDPGFYGTIPEIKKIPMSDHYPVMFFPDPQSLN